MSHAFSCVAKQYLHLIAGACTHGQDRFFAGVYGRVLPGLAFFSLALISTQERRSLVDDRFCPPPSKRS